MSQIHEGLSPCISPVSDLTVLSLTPILVCDLQLVQESEGLSWCVALHPVQDVGHIASYVQTLSLAGQEERVLQQLGVLGPLTLVFHQAEVDEIDELYCKLVSIVSNVAGQSGGISMHNLG